MFLANRLLASRASRAGMLSWPTMRTPRCSTTRPRSAHSQLPPVSTARSTTTEPGFIDSTIARVTSTGAGRPGISAVVMTMSCSRMWPAMTSRSLRL